MKTIEREYHSPLSGQESWEHMEQYLNNIGIPTNMPILGVTVICGVDGPPRVTMEMLGNKQTINAMPEN